MSPVLTQASLYNLELLLEVPFPQPLTPTSPSPQFWKDRPLLLSCFDSQCTDFFLWPEAKAGSQGAVALVWFPAPWLPLWESTGARAVPAPETGTGRQEPEQGQLPGTVSGAIPAPLTPQGTSPPWVQKFLPIISPSRYQFHFLHFICQYKNTQYLQQINTWGHNKLHC